MRVVKATIVDNLPVNIIILGFEGLRFVHCIMVIPFILLVLLYSFKQGEKLAKEGVGKLLQLLLITSHKTGLHT